MKMQAAANPANPSNNEPLPGTPQSIAVRVYYEDTDFSGSVYHASYLRFLERGRTEFLRTLGIEHRELFAGGGKGGYHFAVRSMTIEFLKPALMDDELLVETQVSGLGGASIEMRQLVSRGQQVLITAHVRIAVIAGGKARRLPADILAKLKPCTSAPCPEAAMKL
jgi:acyl-CoA thioester hydrolase